MKHFLLLTLYVNLNDFVDLNRYCKNDKIFGWSEQPISIQFIIVCLNMKMSVITLITLFPAHSAQNSVGKLKEISETFIPPTVSDLKEENMQNVGSTFHNI